jgi:serine/threonine-protein kinase
MLAEHSRSLAPLLVAFRNRRIDQDQLALVLEQWNAARDRDTFELLTERGFLKASDSCWVMPLVQESLSSLNFDIQAEFDRLGANVLSTQDLGDDTDRHDDNSQIEVTQPFRSSELDTRNTIAVQHRFRILRDHAKGGLGKVSLAKDEGLQRNVAIKEIQAQFADDTDSRLRFLREAEVTGRLEHPGIVPVYAVGQFNNGRPYYAMRFIHGDSLREAISQFHDACRSTGGEVSSRDFQGVTFRKLLGRFVDVCHAIAYAHSKGVVHRDLKPSNVMLGEYGETLVVDWGLAKTISRYHENDKSAVLDDSPDSTVAASPLETAAGVAIGTPAYMSPEQASGQTKTLGPSTDIYSLGATLYTLLTGQPPCTGDSLSAVVRDVRAGNIRRPREVEPAIPQPIEAICLKALAPTPEGRYASATELADDLERYLADQAIVALRDTAIDHSRRWLRHHPKTFAGIAASLLIGFVSAALITTVVSGKNALLSSEQRLSEQNANAARGAVNDFLVQVTEADFLKNGSSVEQEFRLQLLNKAREYYESLLTNNRSSTGSEGQLSLADAHHRLAEIEYNLGLFASAIEHTKSAIEIYRPILPKQPKNADRRDELAAILALDSYIKSDLGQHAAARASLTEAIALRQKLVDEGNATSLMRRNLGRNKNSLALLLIESGELETAESMAVESTTQFGEVARSDAVYYADQVDQLLSLLAAADVKSGLGDYRASIELLDQGYQLVSSLLEADPENNEFKSYLANFAQNMAMDSSRLSEHEDALALINESILLREELLSDKFPEFDNRLYLGSAYNTKSQFLLDIRDFQSALSYSDKAVEMFAELKKNETTPHNELTQRYSSALRMRGEIRLFLGNEAEGLQDYQTSLALHKQAMENPQASIMDKYSYAKLLNNYANILDGRGAAEIKVQYYRQAAEVIDEVVEQSPNHVGARIDQGYILGNLGSTVEDPEEAVEILGRSIAANEWVRERANTPRSAADLAWSYNRLASLLTNLDDDKALDYFSKAIETWNSVEPTPNESTKYVQGFGGTLVNSADSHQVFGKFEQAHSMLDQAEELMRPLATGENPHPTIARFYRNGFRVRQNIYRRQLRQAVDQAVDTWTPAELQEIAIANLEIGDPPTFDDYRLAAEVHHHDPDEATMYFQKAIELAEGDAKSALIQRLAEFEQR